MGFSLVTRIIILLLHLHLLLHVSSVSESKVKSVDVTEAKRLLDSDHVFLDVRTVEEYNKGHVYSQKIFNVPYWFFTPQGREKNPNFVEQVSSVCNKSDRIVVGCKSGVRSLQAAKDLIASGFDSVRNMEGGFLEWLNKGFQIEEDLNDEL